jgi:hypothetical protein
VTGNNSYRRIGLLEALILMVIVFFPVNYSLFLKLRIADILIVVLIAIALPNLRTRATSVFFLILVFYLFYFLSMMYGIATIGILNQNNLFFFYKYILAFVLVWTLTSIRLPEASIDRIERLTYFMFGVLVLYALLYPVLRIVGIVRGNIRVTFPFTNVNPEMSDAPLYSVVLTTLLIGYLFTPRPKRRFTYLKNTTVTLFTILAIFISGSRTGLVSVPLTFLIFGMRWVFRTLFSGRLGIYRRVVIISLIVLGVGVVVGLVLRGVSDTNMIRLVQRVTSIDLTTDESIGGRVIKSTRAIDSVANGPVLIGIGMQSSSMTWIDNSYSNILVSAGFGGLIVFLLIVFFFLRDNKQQAAEKGMLPVYMALEYTFINYLISAITSEYFLVTRGVVPFAILTAIFVQRIRRADLPQKLFTKPALSPAV